MKQDELFRLHPERKHPTLKPKAKKPVVKEAEILASVLKALKLYPNVFFFTRMNSGAYAVGEGKARRYVRFGFPGCPDIIGMMRGGRMLCIEVKSPTGKLSAVQERFLIRIRQNGGVAFVARSVDELAKYLPVGNA